MKTEVRSTGRWYSPARRVWQAVVDLILPTRCAGCGRPGTLFCAECLTAISWVKEPVCQRCGRPLARQRSTCFSCRHQSSSLKRIRAAGLYEGPLVHAIHQLKYNGGIAVAEPLAGIMVAAWPRWAVESDLVLPIPLHPEQERKRGYNQSALLVNHLVRQLGWAPAPRALHRVRNTRPQVGLRGAERLTNVRDAFMANEAQVSGRHIILVDDVCTTGATLTAAAEALQVAGARSVAAFCLARAT